MHALIVFTFIFFRVLRTGCAESSIISGTWVKYVMERYFPLILNIVICRPRVGRMLKKSKIQSDYVSLKYLEEGYVMRINAESLF